MFGNELTMGPTRLPPTPEDEEPPQDGHALADIKSSYMTKCDE